MATLYTNKTDKRLAKAYFLSEAAGKGDDASFFVSAFCATIIIVYILMFVIVKGDIAAVIKEAELIALWLPTLAFFTGGMWFRFHGQTRFKRAIDKFFSKISWYIFGFHLVYAYELPLLKIFLSKIISPDLETSLPFAIMTSTLVGYFIIVHLYIETRIHRNTNKPL